MISAQEFKQLIEILPRLEQFARTHQLTSLSLVKTSDPQRAEADLYLCYTHEGDEHALDKVAEIDRLFTQLWGLPLFNETISAQDKSRFDQIKFEQRFQPTEIFLLRTNEDNDIQIATSNEIVEYAKRQFDIICDTVIDTQRVDSVTNNNRNIGNEEIDKKKATISSISFFTQAPTQTQESNVDEQIDKLSLHECREHLKNLCYELGITDLNQINIKLKKN